MLNLPIFSTVTLADSTSLFLCFQCPGCCRPRNYDRREKINGSIGTYLWPGQTDRYFCPTETETPFDCPLGSYCPGGTAWGAQYKCPIGTFGDAMNLVNVTMCSACTAGQGIQCAGGCDSINVVISWALSWFHAMHLYGASVVVLAWHPNHRLRSRS